MIPLVARSHYSLMWGTASPEALCAVAQRRGYRHLALTDTDNVYGLWPFFAAAKEYGLQPLIGAEVTDPQNGERAVCLEPIPVDENVLYSCEYNIFTGDISWVWS
ncbi:MAG: PHP domain-containing protein [Myxococcales bacterium]|nr:MAG: PHP domain-containing protein [Myxococcales bacterium]